LTRRRHPLRLACVSFLHLAEGDQNSVFCHQDLVHFDLLDPRRVIIAAIGACAQMLEDDGLGEESQGRSDHAACKAPACRICLG
jgi:hypothetical protein